MQKLIFIYFIAINLFAFVMFSFDKYRATKKGASRISERELHTLSALGGFLGATLSMTLFRHKIKKVSFLIKHIFIMLVWIVGILYYFTELNELNFLR